jgi:hypothetical protein
MKKVLLAVFVAALVLSCGPDYYDSVVSNESAVTVTYTYAGSRNTLQPGDSKSYSIALDEINIKNVKFTGHPKSVIVTHQEFDWIFTPAPEIELKVKNEYSSDVTVTCEYLDSGNSSTSLTVETGKESTGNIKIYTEKPVFTVKSKKDDDEFIPIVDKITYNPSGPNMYVLIK